MSLESYWDRFADVLEEPPNDPTDRGFFWTQWDRHGPGAELLGAHPRTVLELGSGDGTEIAYLAHRGILATGVDLSPAMCERATRHWAHVSGATFVHAEVCAFLEATDTVFDAIYSRWGAVWFSDPGKLLPLVHDHLTPDGVLAFSQAPAIEGCYGPQGMYGNGYKGKELHVQRWAYTPTMWTDILTDQGFDGIDAHVLPAPDPENLGTLIVRARKPKRGHLSARRTP
ncbi:class I SAM-dependent methyltransferase [Embleya sp. MST-111070]|uniref:class I SAM-dependent methyltransferase n=1 Tax=Embleya sp. MST-111070 TaxID=3398231 RepID=UPI003F73CCDC